MAKDIWEKSLNGEIANSNSKNANFYINKRPPRKLDDLNLRNYFHTHTIEEISADSMYGYFGDNVFLDFNGLFLPHLIVSSRLSYGNYGAWQRIIKALDAAFQFIDINTGSLTEENFNFIQWLILSQVVDYGRFGITSVRLLERVYKYGVDNGMNEDFKDTNFKRSIDYAFGCCDFDVLSNLFDGFSDNIFQIEAAPGILCSRVGKDNVFTGEESFMKYLLKYIPENKLYLCDDYYFNPENYNKMKKNICDLISKIDDKCDEYGKKLVKK